MSDLPSGTVTFLFTDIEGSTRLVQQLGERYASLLNEQQRLLREACETNHGSVVSTHGDSFFVAFSSAVDAIHAAVSAQHMLFTHSWTDGVSVRVRMGLHTGEPQISSADYVGIDVHRAARIAAAAHGGQVLLSGTTHDLVESEMPAGVTLQDLGEHRLKDLRQSKHLYQLVISGLPSEFPPIKSLVKSPNNLPIQLTSFIGRSKEKAEIEQLLSEERLVTLTGPGGSGKTRLALQVAAEMVDHFDDGVFLVELAPISDPGLVASTIAQPFGITETTGQSIVDRLKADLDGKSTLLLLDNFEHLIPAAPLVAELLAACRELKIMVTSREGLHVGGEREYPVSPLELPELSRLPDLETLTQIAAVELFLQRSRAVKPDFQITDETAAEVAEICCRLDGMPLAIELAAARTRLFSPEAMLERLEHRLEFLTGGARDLPRRQRTLRNTIAWSYDLLNADEQKLFRRVSVFVGGCTLEAVETVAGDAEDQASVLDRFGSLLDKHLLREVEGVDAEARFMMLETLREFGLERLEQSGEADAVRFRHSNFCLALAERAVANLESPEQIQWLGRLEQEHDNLRAALEWSQTAEGAGEIPLRLAAALGIFWETRGYFSEGRERLSAILSLNIAQGKTVTRARLLTRAAELAYRQSDYPATTAFARESLAICREVGNRRGMAIALLKLGNVVTEEGDYQTASKYYHEALEIWRKLKDHHGTARALISLGWVGLRLGDLPLAKERLQGALAIYRKLGDTGNIGFVLSGLGEVALRQGSYGEASRLLEESLELRKQVGYKWGIGVSQGILGLVALRQGDWDRAVERLGESLEMRKEIGDRGGIAWCLEHLAEVALAQGQAEKSARLYGAAAGIRLAIGSVIDPVDLPEYESKRESALKELGTERFMAAWDQGRGFNLDQAIAYAGDVGKLPHSG